MPPKPSQPRLTHFLCLPLVTNASRPQLSSSLTHLRNSITNKYTPENPSSIPEKAIRPLGTLHLTLGVMSLSTPEKVQSAISLLSSLDLKAIRSANTAFAADELDPVKITLRGLKSMHTPSKTSILYSSPVDDDGRLQSFCQALRDRFIDAELMLPDDRPLLLHATILNTVYVPGIRTSGGGHGKHRAKLTIDARKIIEDFEDVEWMVDVSAEKVAVCRMGAKKMGNGDEEYIEEGSVEIQ